MYAIIDISSYESRRKAKYETTRFSEQTAYVIDSSKKTNLALTPTEVPETNLTRACQKGDGTRVAIASMIKPSIFVSNISKSGSSSRDYFDYASFSVADDKTEVYINKLPVCSKGFYKNCVYMFWLPPGETKFNPKDLKGYTDDGLMFEYEDIVIITGTIAHEEGNSGSDGCLITVDRIQSIE